MKNLVLEIILTVTDWCLRSGTCFAPFKPVRPPCAVTGDLSARLACPNYTVAVTVVQKQLYRCLGRGGDVVKLRWFKLGPSRVEGDVNCDSDSESSVVHPNPSPNTT